MLARKVFVWASVVLVALATLFSSNAANLAEARAKPEGKRAPLHVKNNVVDGPNGLQLGPKTGSSPFGFQGYSQYGVAESETVDLGDLVEAVQVDYAASTRGNSRVQVQVQGSTDGESWYPWNEVKGSGSTTYLRPAARYVRYRVFLMSNGSNPVVSDVSITPLPGVSAPAPAAVSGTVVMSAKRLKPTAQSVTTSNYTNTQYATEEAYSEDGEYYGPCGGTTYSGYVLECDGTDFLVALPHYSVVNTYGSTPYQFTVTLTSGSYSVSNVPVLDVGPWNVYDNYWVASGRDYWGIDTETYGLIPRGNAEAYEAWTWGYHNSYTSSHPCGNNNVEYSSPSDPGTQISPSAGTCNGYSTTLNNRSEIDLGDQVWNALHMVDNGFITVTFNWVAP